MKLVLGVALFMATQTTVDPRSWSWSLYEGSGPLVLAQEIPDTPRLRTILECDPGSGQVRISLYDSPLPPGPVRFQSGQAVSEGELTAGRDTVQTTLRTQTPVFTGFQSDGRLSLSAEGQTTLVEIERASLNKLRRFAELCAG